MKNTLKGFFKHLEGVDENDNSNLDDMHKQENIGRAESKPFHEHKFIYLEQRLVGYNENGVKMCKYMDVYYCEKCLEYKFKDCQLTM